MDRGFDQFMFRIVSIFIGAKYNLNYLALGGIAATFFQLLLILIDIKKSDYMILKLL